MYNDTALWQIIITHRAPTVGSASNSHIQMDANFTQFRTNEICTAAARPGMVQCASAAEIFIFYIQY